MSGAGADGVPGAGARQRACEPCLRRGLLLGLLAPRIAGVADSHDRNPTGLLSLGDHELVAAVAGTRRAEAESFLEGFDAAAARRRLQRREVVALCRHSREYPTRLLQLADPPAALFVIGNPETVLEPLACGPVVAVVGSRRPSPYGLEMARSIGRGLAAARVTVVSGLALGIDAAAHVGCLEGGGRPVAVLGGGPDVPYPRTNSQLHKRIAGEGLLMSEIPPGHGPYRWSFPARNRIMAGLSEACVVVEAAQRSGSLITTDFAADLGRVVAAVPGQATSSRARGSNALLRSGAAVINRVEDVLEELFGAGVVGEAVEQGELFEPPDPQTRAVLEAVEAGTGIDGACDGTGLPAGEVRAILARLEETGAIRRAAFGAYTRAAP